MKSRETVFDRRLSRHHDELQQLYQGLYHDEEAFQYFLQMLRRCWGERKKAVMNFAEPSGSSPPEKPPGIMTICDSPISRANSVVDSATASGVRLFTT